MSVSEEIFISFHVPEIYFNQRNNVDDLIYSVKHLLWWHDKNISLHISWTISYFQLQPIECLMRKIRSHIDVKRNLICDIFLPL